MFSAQMTYPVIGLYSVVVLRATPFTVGLIYGVSAVTAFVLRIPAAMVGNKIGQRKTMIAGLGATTIGSVIYGFASNVEHMVVGSFLRGLGSAFFFPAALSTVYEEAGEGRGDAKSLGYLLTGPAMGMAVGPVVGAFSLSVAGYQLTFLNAAAVSLAGLCATALTEDHAPNGEKISLAAVSNKRFTALLASRFLVNYVMGTIGAFLPLMAALALGYDEPFILLMFTAAALTNLLSRVGMGSAASKIGAQNYVTLGSLIVSVSALMLIFTNEALTWSAMLIYGFGMGVFVVGSVYITGLVVPASARILGFALITLMIDLGNSVGTFVSGVLLSLGGFTEVFAVAAVVGLVGTLIDVFSRRWLLPVEKQSQSSVE